MRIRSLLSATAASLLLLTACGGDNEEAPADTAEPTAETDPSEDQPDDGESQPGEGEDDPEDGESEPEDGEDGSGEPATSEELLGRLLVLDEIPFAGFAMENEYGLGQGGPGGESSEELSGDPADPLACYSEALTALEPYFTTTAGRTFYREVANAEGEVDYDTTLTMGLVQVDDGDPLAVLDEVRAAAEECTSVPEEPISMADQPEMFEVRNADAALGEGVCMIAAAHENAGGLGAQPSIVDACLILGDGELLTINVAAGGGANFEEEKLEAFTAEAAELMAATSEKAGLVG